MAKKNVKTSVAYICNGRQPECKGQPGCYYNKVSGRPGPCLHTTDIRYAKHKKIDPKKDSDKFDKFTSVDKEGNKSVRYYEKLGEFDK